MATITGHLSFAFILLFLWQNVCSSFLPHSRRQFKQPIVMFKFAQVLRHFNSEMSKMQMTIGW